MRSLRSVQCALITGVVAGLNLLLSSCYAAAPSPLQPRGPNADTTLDILWALLIVGSAAFLVTMVLLGFGLYRARRRTSTSAAREAETDEATNPPAIEAAEHGLGRRFVLFGGGIIPALILLGTFGYTIFIMDQTGFEEMDSPFTIHVVGHQWWWEVHYPAQEFVTANEIHVPVGEPVEITITSADVIHSFWVPQIHSIIDAIPGDLNRIKFEADEPGIYRGECTEYCGIQHAKMFFFVVAEPRAAFEEWLAQQQLPATEPTDPLLVWGKELFFEKTCDNCHRIAGTQAQGELGPDLTHLDSRLTLGAGILENNRGNLAGWIMDPQSIKLGALMPLTDYSGEELQALLAYLESLD